MNIIKPGIQRTTSYSPIESLQTPLQYLKGVGPTRAEILARLGLQVVEDLLFHFPREHQFRRVIPFAKALPGQKQTFRGQLAQFDVRRLSRTLGQARATLNDNSGALTATWFKRLSFQYDVFASLKRQMMTGHRYEFYGGIEEGPQGLELRVEDFDPVDSSQKNTLEKIVPVYPLTEGLNEKWLRNLMRRIIPKHAFNVRDPLPETLRQQHRLVPLHRAILHFHFPSTWQERDEARERLAFDEFFFLELALALNRSQRKTLTKGFQYVPQKTLLSPFKNQLGYEFTKAQKRAINEIFRDMANPISMNRLLQGDVGAGKTVVALSAILLAIENNRQAAFLAPTEILAEQHALTIAKFFCSLPVRWALLTGSTPKNEREKIIQKLANDKLDLLIGTHAILEEDVVFKKLGLIVIDEQHRFGVRQRQKLLNKSKSGLPPPHDSLEEKHPDVLIMTATPIPRTLALTLYGDLDVSLIDELPKGRSRVTTSMISEQTALERVEEAAAEGHQAYIVFPLIEESDLLSKRRGSLIKAVRKEFDRLKSRFPRQRLGLLHGQMASPDKKQVMDLFRKGEIQILASTPVIEVGIDVPNATTMMIMSPERFGLAQLHQLRGRVGRGPALSECLLVVDDAQRPRKSRLEIFCAIEDGFRLAEEDLKLRGPGEVLGEAQHGLPFFKVGDLLKDGLLICQCREGAQRLVQGEWSLTMQEFRGLNTVLMNRFGNKLQLSLVG